jgi:hypothetical protein
MNDRLLPAPAPCTYETEVIVAELLDCDFAAEPVGDGLQATRTNFIRGRNPANWIADAPSFERLVRSNVYPGIDLRYYGDERHLEYDFVVSPGADYNSIRIRYDGALSLSVNADGDLVIETALGDVVEKAPLVYQIEGDRRIALQSSYRLVGDNTFGFSLGSDHNSALAVVIDPVLAYSTFLGGTDGSDRIMDMVVDTQGRTYVFGHTTSSDFPVVNSYTDTLTGGQDLFVARFAPDGASLEYGTYIGGSAQDNAATMAVDAAGNVYLGGDTHSTDFPLRNAWDPTYVTTTGTEAYLLKVNAAGDSLIFSTYLGGSSYDAVAGIALDADTNIYVLGSTQSTNFPTVNAWDSSANGGADAFVCKFPPDGSAPYFSTYIGGTGDDLPTCIAINSDHQIYIAGLLLSTNYPVVHAYQPARAGSYDAFISMFSPGGDSLQFSTYFGGTQIDAIYSMRVDSASNVYIAGNSYGAGFPVVNAYDSTHNGGYDVFVTKATPRFDSLIYSTYIGGTGDDRCWNLAIDSEGRAYVTGYTVSDDYPTVDAPYIVRNGLDDILVSALDPTGSVLLFSTYYGGAYSDQGEAIALGPSGDIYVAGGTLSFNLPMVNSFDATIGGSSDAFLAKFSSIATDVAEIADGNRPESFTLDQNYPNPFNPTTTIEFTLPRRSRVTIQIYNLLGQEVTRLVDKEYAAGNYRVTWDGRTADGAAASTGIYLYRLQTDSYSETRKMVLLK